MSERIARAHRAKSALDEFISPLFAEIEAEYTARIAEIARTELHPATRADKITTLSVALRVTETIRAGLTEIIRDGELAAKEKLKAESIQNMSDARQRLLRVAPGY